MEWAEDLFVAENVTELETVVYALRRNIPVPRLSCIVFFHKENRFEILSSKELATDRCQRRGGTIVGVAFGHREAVDLLSFMVEEAVREGKDLTLQKSWFAGGTNEGI